MINKIEVNWDQMSKIYDEFTQDENSYSNVIEWPCIKEILPSIHGKRVLDLGCGTGRFTFLLEKEQPSSILGIDLSEQMIQIAKEKSKLHKSNAEFVKGDITNFNTYIHGIYDFIFSSTTLHYISDLKCLFQNIYNVLDDNGVCIVSVMHPVYTAQYPVHKPGQFPSDEEWIVRYLDKSERGYVQPWIEFNDDVEDFLSTSYHYTFSDYMNAIISSGLKIECVKEPMPPVKWKEDNLGRYNSYIETPSYMILKLSKR